MSTTCFGAFTLHTDRRQLFHGGSEVHLTPKAFDLLVLLIERSPAVVAKADIHQHLWPATFVSDATLVGLVKEVRRALGDEQARALIRTAHRVGYAFTGSTTTAKRPAGGTHWLMIGTRRIPLRDGATLLGRDPDATVWLDVAGVSRRHAQITVADGTATLEDLGSKNGTLVADRPVRGRVALRNADRIQLATEVLVYRVSGRGISTVTRPSPPESEPD